MVRYSKEQLDRNRQRIGSGLFCALVILIFAVLAGIMNGQQAMAAVLLVVAIGGPLWWLFGARTASSIDDTWVDGWRVEPDDPYRADGQRSGLANLSVGGQRRRPSQPDH